MASENASPPAKPDPTAWEDETSEERKKRRDRHQEMAEDKDPKNLSIQQQALSLADPLAEIEDAILYMDSYNFSDGESEIYEGHVKILKKLREARGGVFSLFF